MDVILLKEDLTEIGPCLCDIDFDVGLSERSTNDFQMSGSLPDGASGIYIPGTEFGGLIEYMQTSNTDERVKYKGFTWRGLLTQGIICPPEGADYLTVTGDANEILSQLLSSFFGGFFYVPDVVSGISINEYRFPRYCTFLDGITDMLSDHGAKLKISAGKTAAGQPVRVTIQAERISAIGDKYSSESQVSMTYTDDQMGINHLICMGQGELKERQRVDLYVGPDGAISDVQYFTGAAERTALYDYSSAQSTQELISYGKKRLLELQSKKRLEINDAEVNGDIGDLVYGFMAGQAATSPIVQKILTITGGVWKYESKIEGDS